MIKRGSERICAFNDGVICTTRTVEKCRHCGWNPREIRRRKAYDPPPEIDEAKAKAFFEMREIEKWREGTFGKTEEAKE